MLETCFLESSMRIAILGALALASLSLVSTPAHAGAIVSAYKKETKKGANYYNAQSAIDGDPTTCWMVPGESENKGEHITIDVPKSTIDKVGMIIGWNRDEETFTDYFRVKKVRLEVLSYGATNELTVVAQTDVEFADTSEYQFIDIDDIEVGQDLAGGKVRITITEVYEGRDYPNFGISEIALALKEFDAPAKVSDVSGETQDNVSGYLTDGDSRTFWSAEREGAWFTVSSFDFSISSIGIELPKSKDFARPKKIKVSIQGVASEIDLADKGGMQWVNVPPVMGYTGGGFGEIVVTILETHPGSTYADQVAITGVDARASAYQGF
jgi:hypothetical protein